MRIPSGAEYVTLHMQIRWRKGKKYADLYQENGFGPAYVVKFAAEAGKAEESCAPAREECNKYDLSDFPCF